MRLLCDKTCEGAFSCAASLKRLAWFALSIALASAALTGVVRVLPFAGELPWWKVFRRCVCVAAVLMLWVFMRRVHGQSIRSLGLGSWEHGKGQLLRGLLLGFGVVVLMGGVYLASHIVRVSVHPDPMRVWRTLIGFLPAAGLIAVLEELIFRGYVLQQLLVCSQRLAVAGSSAAYAFVHLRPNPVWPGSGFEFVGLFFLGWILARSVLRTRQLYLAIGLHASLAYCARVNKLLVEFAAPSLQWLVGTNRLVNGVIAWLALLGIGRWLARQANAPNRMEVT